MFKREALGVLVSNRARRGVVAVSWAAALLFASGCQTRGESRPEAVATSKAALSGGDAGPASPSIGTFAVYASEAIELNSNTSITGCNVGVENTTGPFLADGSAAELNSEAKIQSTQTLYAASVFLNSGASVGAVDTNALTGNAGATHGTVSTFPAMPALPTAPSATAGTAAVTVNSGASKTLGAGAYGSVTVNANATLSLTGGTYVFSSLTLNSGATLQTSAPAAISVTGAASFNSGASIGPTSASKLTAKALVLYFDSSSSIMVNTGAKVRALLVAPRALVTLNTSSFTGAVAAAQVELNSGATVTCEDSFGSLSLCASVTCTAMDQCHVAGTCNPSTGQCSNPTAANGTSCNDGDACDLNDSCQVGVCTAGSHVTCTAPDSCHTAGTCNATTGVCSAPTLNAGFCSIGGACVAAGAANGANTCESCQPAVSTTQYSNVANGTACNDGSLCDSNDSCKAGVCTAGSTVVCTASDSCHVAGTCNPATGQCSNPVAANGTACNDGSLCDLNDSCQAGVCTAGSTVLCIASDPCHVGGICNPVTGTCSNPVAPNGTTCNDGNACTQTDSCQSGTCVGSNPVTCTASDQCHGVGVCSPATGTCSSPALTDGTSCTGSNPCNQTYACAGGTCTGSNPVTCTALDGCHVAGQCQASTGTCTNPTAPDGTSCTGSDLCNQSYACAGGTCTGSNPVACTASGQCQVPGTCNPSTGTCSTATAPDGTSCNDGNPCTTGDSCAGGTCAGTAVTCTASDACHTAGSCDPTSGACSNPTVPDGTVCSGSDLCQTYACQGGTCGGAPITCQALDVCHTAGTCDPTTGQCSNPAIPGCDSSPTIGDNPFETKGSVIGRVQTYTGSPVTGYTLSLYDMPVGDEPRADVQVTTGSDGSFWAHLTSFPTSEPPHTPPHHLMAYIDALGYVRARRDFYVHPGMAVDLGVIDVALRDSNTVTIDASGGSVTDSQGLITVQFPPGALSAPTPITVTPIAHRQEMPAALPPISATGYGFEIEPSGTVLNAAATVQVTNWRNIPTTVSMPVGFFDDTNGGWKHVAMATWSGTAWTAQIQHFSNWDFNPNEYGEWVLFGSKGRDPNGTKANACVGSSVSLNGGDMSFDIALPSYPHRGRDFGVTLNYNSALAASRSLGTPPQTTAGAIPVTGVAVAIRGDSFQRQCIASQTRAAVLIAATPGACGGGSCSLATATGGVWSFETSLLGMQSTLAASPTGNANAIDYGGWVDLPLMPDGTVPSSGFLNQQVQAGPEFSGTSGTSSACLTSGAFASPDLGAAVQSVAIESGPLFTIQREVFMHHRHSSPFGPGWAISNLSRIFQEPQADHAVLIGGDGSEEDFRIRPEVTSPYANVGYASYAFALDPTTGAQLMATGSGNVVELNANGSQTAVASGVGFTGVPQSMAVTYVGGEQRILIATTTELVQVHPGGAIDVLYTRSGNGAQLYVPSQVAARNDLAIYTEGKDSNPVLYRIRLSTPPGAPEVISFPQATGGDIGLDPAQNVLSQYRFYGPGGEAYTSSGALFVADAPRSAVYLVQPDVNGEIGPTSAIARALGDGAGRYVPDLGTPFSALDFPINQPFLLSVSPDGTLLMGTQYGVAAYDPQATQAEWIAFGQSAPNSTLPVDLTGTSGQYTNIAATGPRSFLIAFSQSGTWPSVVNASQLASEYDPTRTLTLSPAGATLVDTTQGVVDSFDGQGRLAQRNLRTSEPVFAVTYVDPVSDRVQTISDPEGGVTTFAYDSSNRLSTITDPANRQTTFAHDGFGDLRSITQPDGEVTSYTYQAHQVVTKTTRGTDVTSYVYNSDGTLQSATKPAGETTTVTATSLSQSPQYDSNGNPTYSGSYTDAHGVTHTFVTDALGQLQSDTYTADGIQYNYGVTYYNGAGGQLEPVSGEVYGHRNTILRIGSERLNGVPTGPSRSFDSLGRLVAISDSPGLHSGQTIASYSFNANGFLSDIALQGVSFIDKQITRDAAGHILQVLDHGNEGYSNRHEVDYTWRSDGQPATVTRDGLLYTLTYDDAATHQLTGISDALGRTTSFSLDSVGRVGMTTVGNPGANAGDGSTTTSFAYDDNDRLRVVADALGNQTLFGYTQVSCGCTEADEVTSIETPDLLPPKQWQLVYGPEGRLSTIADPAGFPEAYGYEPTGELNSIVDRDGNTTALTHDHLGRVATVVDALNRTHGRLYSIPTNGSWSGPTLTSGSASSTPASTNYASTLNAGDYQIGNGLYPVYGQPPSESFYRDATFELPYVAGWDLGNRLTTYVERPAQPSSAVETLDGTGNPASISYDQYTSQVTGFSKTGRGFSGFGYNNDYDLTGSNGYGAGNCIGDPQTNYTYQRDLGNRVTQVQTSYGLGCFAPLTVQSQRYTYFADGALQSYSGPDGNRTYAYDARGLVHILTDSADKNESWSFTYDTAGRSFDVTYPDGHVREQLYDDEGRLKSRCYKYGSQSFCYTATYDGAGNPLTTSDPYGGSETYQYDAVNRLTSVTRSVGGSVEHVETYSYNALGALHTGFDVTAMAEVTYDDKRATLSGSGTADSAIPNSLEGQPVTRDSLGEVTAFAGSTLTFNTAHRVVSAQANDGSVSETYRYDPSLRRNYLAHTETNAANNVQELYMYDRPGSNLLSAVDPSGTTAYSEDPGNIIATLNTSGVIQNSYLFAGVDQPLRVTQWSWVCPTFNEACTTGTSQPVCVNHTSVNCVSTPSPVYYEVDVTGNVRRFRNAGSGDLGGYRYTAFGQTFPPDATTPATTVTQLLRWKGRPFVNVAGGLYDMRARFWNPQMGAFLNIDAYAYHDASSTLWGWGNQNPIRYGDPSGRVIVALDQAALVALNNLENNPNLLAQLQELENDPNLVIEIMHDASDLANFPGGSVACSDGSGLCAIGYDMATAPLGDDLEEVLAHELGHVYGLYFGEDIKEEDYSVEFENLQRGGPVCR